MAVQGSSGIRLFTYTNSQASAIRQSLEQAGVHSDTDWTRLLQAITQIARSAQINANSDKPLYAAEAAKQARDLAEVMSSAAERNDTLGVDLQALVASHMDLALELEEAKLLCASLLAHERPVLKKLLWGHRLSLLLQTVARGFELVAAPLEAGGKVVPLSSPLPAQLPLSVRKTVTRAVRPRRRPFDGRFPHSGTPKEETVRWAVPRLWGLYQQVTGEQPRIYPNSYKGAIDGYGGKFYPFVKATLQPLRLLSAKSLPNAIYTAYQTHRTALLPEPPIRREKTRSDK